MKSQREIYEETWESAFIFFARIISYCQGDFRPFEPKETYESFYGYRVIKIKGVKGNWNILEKTK